MRIVGAKLLHAFCERHADARHQVEAWVAEVEEAAWKSTVDIQARYASASFLSQNRVILNLKGNKYRLLITVSYKNQIVQVKSIATHADYSKLQL